MYGARPIILILPLAVILLISLAVVVGVVKGGRLTNKRFQDWYWYDDSFANMLRDNCSTEYANYLNHIDSHWYFSWPTYRTTGSAEYWVYMHPVLTCLLDITNELSKSEMGAAGVLLGLMPTILAYAGSNLVETALLAARRPLLAFLLGIGSPAVPVLRTFQHPEVHKMLKKRSAKHGLTVHVTRTVEVTTFRMLIVVAEYVLALAAIANCILAAYELGMKTYISWSADVFFHPLLWSLTPGLVHLFGVWTFRLDVSRIGPSRLDQTSFRERLWYWVKDEFTPCVSQGPTTFKYKPESYTFLVVSWWAAILTLAHYIYGTV